MRHTRALSVSLALGLLLLSIGGTASAQSQTAQSAMVQTNFDSTAYIIEGTITWTFDQTAAATYFTNAWDGNAPQVGCTGGPGTCQTAPATPPAPAPEGNRMTPFLNSQAKCVFFLGGLLPNSSYTQTVAVNVGPPAPSGERGNWRFTYTYNISPISTAAVEAHTAWTSQENVSAVDVGFTGFVASESFLKQANRNKYSFTMVDGGVSRARNVAAILQKSDGLGGWVDGPAADLNNQDTDADTVNDALIIAAASADFGYFGNGGVFGNLAVFSALHADGGKSQNLVSNILNGISDGSNSDNFAGNNNDLAAGNVHVGPFEGTFSGITEDGSYRVKVTGALKGNSSSADFGFAVGSDIVTIGGCSVP